MSIITLDSWDTPATRYKRGKTGSVEIVDVSYRRGCYEAYNTGPNDEECLFFRVKKSIKITALEIDGKVWMVDDPPHWWAMQDHARHYHGHVVVAGLGLGLILHAMKDNPRISRITLVERSTDVINAILPYLPELPLTIIQDDWYKFRTDEPVDGVFFDLFVGEGRELMGNAMRESICIAQQFPNTNTIRIHGFGDFVHNLGVANRTALNAFGRMNSD